MKYGRSFSVNSLVVFKNPAGDREKQLVKECQGEGPFMVCKRKGFPPGHEKHAVQPEMLFIAVTDGSLREVPASIMRSY